ncbi:MAG: type VI secretion system membrane subunit TssM [Ketobacteraceae bacterium]|nr:type VI secretion system membrane subunit TssM [Ketobacteraceae bacterium]
MRRTLTVLKSRWFVSLVGVLALSLLIWFVGPLIAIADYKPLVADWVRMLFIVLLLLLWAGSNMYRLSKSKANDRKLAEGVTEAPEQAVEQDVSAVKSQFNEAIAILKRASGGKKRSGNYLYELPWYLMIGPPGSGKTTALVNSGLEFPLEDHYGKSSVKGVGGTRHCDWWFTNEAVLIDTAGRYTTQDSHQQTDRAEWKKFIDLLKKYRKRQPINGVLVAISVEDLLGAKTDQEVDRQIKAIRARLQELIDDLGVQVPVYLIFTKCDLIRGFQESFESLNREMRSQVWGMTLPSRDGADHINYQEWFTDEFAGLIERLQEQQIQRFYYERQAARRNRILNFPHELAGARERFAEFVGKAFSDSRFHDQFFLRGIYFTSGTQDASSLHRAIHQMANPLGIQAKQVLNEPQGGRSYFLRSLLHDVVFAEAYLVGANRRYEIVSRWFRGATLVSCIVLIGLAGVGFSAGFASNQLNLQKMAALTEDFTGQLNAVSTDYLPIALDPAVQTLNGMKQVFNEATQGWNNLGLYQGDKINTALVSHQENFRHQALMDALSNELEDTLQQQKHQPDRLRHTLKTYLMLADREHFDAGFVRQWFSHHWKNRYFDQPQALARLHAQLDLLLEDFPFTEIDNNLVADTRDIIRRVPLDRQILNAMKLEADQRYAVDYRFADALGADFYRIFEQDNHAIPGFYTFEGYNDIFKPGLASAIEELAEDNWVVGSRDGDLTDMDLAEVQTRVEKQYYENYISYWESHLASIRVKQTGDLSELALFIDMLRAGRSPLRGVLEELAINTQLTVTVVSEEDIKEGMQDAQQVARALTPKANRLARIATLASRNKFANLPENPTQLVDKRFSSIHKFVEPQGNRPAKFEELLESLAELQFFAERILNAGSESEAAYNVARKRFSNPPSDIIASLRMDARHYPEPVNRWISDINMQVWRSVLAAAKDYVDREYRHGVLPIYERTIAQRYPFSKNADREVTLHDFSQFFKAEGVADLFFSDYLEPFVNTKTSPWRLKSVDGYSLAVNRHYLAQFERAQKIQELFFSDGDNPAVGFSTRPVYLDANVSRFEINMLGERQVYRHGPPRLMEIRWPSGTLDSAISFQFEDYYNARAGDRVDGPWSLFRFLDKYPLEPTRHGNRYQLKLENKGQKAVYEIIAASARTPLAEAPLSRFRLPASL